LEVLLASGTGRRQAKTDPPAATTLFQSRSDNEPSEKIDQFWLNSSRVEAIAGVPSFRLLASVRGMRCFSERSNSFWTTRALVVLMSAGASKTSTNPTCGLLRRGFLVSMAKRRRSSASSSREGCRASSREIGTPFGRAAIREMKACASGVWGMSRMWGLGRQAGRDPRIYAPGHAGVLGNKPVSLVTFDTIRWQDV